MTEDATKRFFFFEPNIVPTLLLISHVVKYDIGSNDLDAIKYGLTATSIDKDIWYSYKLIGEKTIDIRCARDEENTDTIFMELTFDKILSTQIDLCIYVIEEFFISHREIHTDMKRYE